MNLTSIEPIGWMFAPQLSKIDLSDNYLTCLKPFAKCNFIMEELQIGSEEAQSDQIEYLHKTKLP
jgi:hypothetical protein